MSDNEQNHELNDELLSAYLDGELSEAERAAVEARLASDPVAQHTLHQLRSVSQAVQALPLEPAGRDLRDQILRRVENAKPAVRSTADTSSTKADKVSLFPGDSIPRIAIFQTRRSWIWASLVVAAGLMIMVLQSSDEKERNLPAVARLDNGEVAKDAHREPVNRSLKEPASDRAIDPAQVARMDSPSSVSGVSGPEAPMGTAAPGGAETSTADKLALDDRAAAKPEMPAAAPTSIESNGQRHDLESDMAFRGGAIAGAGPPSPALGNRAGEASISSNSPASPAPENRTLMLGVNGELKAASGKAAQTAAGKSTVPQSAGPGRAGGVGGGFESTAGQPMESKDEQSSLVHVVHIVAKRDAIQNKAFDQLLARNGIELTPQPPAAARTSGGVDRNAKQAELNRSVDKLEARASEEERDVELVFVEAPKSAILSCLAGLNKDSGNYVGVEADDALEAQDRADNKASLEKKVVTELGRYNRGIVTVQQKDAFRNRYYYTDANSDRSKSDFDVKGEVSDELKPQQIKTEVGQEKQKQLATVGRARRVEPWETKTDQSGHDKPIGGALHSQSLEGAKSRRAEFLQRTPADAENANWQVLFVLSPDREAAPSVPAEKATK